MRVFLDIGAHDGETLLVARQRRFAFDKIVCVEPSPICVPRLRALSGGDNRVEIVAAGLWSADAQMNLAGSGSVGASVVQGGEGDPVNLIDAATFWSTHVQHGDQVWLKINIEGAEHAVIRRWRESPGFAELRSRVRRGVVHVDTDKIEGMSGPSAETRAWLAELGWDDARAAFVGRDVTDKTMNWLLRSEGTSVERFSSAVMAPVVHRARRRVFLLRKRLGLLPRKPGR